MTRPTLLCLLPARNAAADLPGYLSSVARFADGVVALDDGSTDATRELLAASPLVKVLLTNPPRPDYRAWDDAANRNRLLEAAATLDPAWIISLDADERIPPDDAAALRAFVETEADPDYAYGLKVYRMWVDQAHCARGGLWVFRLFAYAPGQRFPDRRLHFVPIPTTIPRDRWRWTTVRIQHLASLTAERRQARVDKYREADPDNAFEHGYEEMLEPAAEVYPWEPRPPRLPVGGEPALSAIVIAHKDETRIERAVAGVVAQKCWRPFEVIVVTSGGDRTAQIVRERFPQVTVIELARRALPGEACNVGLSVARGEVVVFPGSHIELPQGSLAFRLDAHNLGYAMVTGPVLNGTETWAGWASYFLDHSALLPDRLSTELQGSPTRCSYRRSALLTLGEAPFPPDLRAGEDTVVNQALARRGYVAYFDEDAREWHYSLCRTPWRLVHHHFQRGRSMGRILLAGKSGRGRVLWTEACGWLGPGHVPSRLRLIRRNVHKWGSDLRRDYLRSLPLILLGAVAFWLGAWFELLRPASRATVPSRQLAEGVRH